jgi:hypothetical protein
MTDIPKILKTVQDIQASLAVLPEIQTHIAKLTDAVNALRGHDTIDVPTATQLFNGVSSSFVLPNVSPTVVSIESTDEGMNDVKAKSSKDKNEKIQSAFEKENQLNSAESADKTKKKLTLSERKKLRKLKKKQVTKQLSPGESSSNELDVKSTPEIQPSVVQDQQPTKDVAPSRVAARPPPRLHVSFF